MKDRTPQEIWDTLWPVLSKKYKRTETFLDHTNVWELLVAVILSAQMTDDGVNKITPALFARFPTPQDLAMAKPREVIDLVKKVNYYNAKARNIQRTARMIVEEFNGVVPDTVEALMRLPGVGRKTAVAVLSNGFNKNVGIPVDTHVIRFVHRFGLSEAKNPDQIEQDLLQIIPKKHWRRVGYAIKEYGRKEGRARGYDQASDPLWHVLEE